MSPSNKEAIAVLVRGVAVACGFVSILGIAIGWKGAGWLVMLGLLAVSVILFVVSSDLEK